MNNNGLSTNQKLAKILIHSAYIGAGIIVGASLIAPLFAGGASSIGIGLVLTRAVGVLASKSEVNYK
jgi:F0F1-type ATP synthase membrane subunit c/vacuolar-type H+-ATPase subunit K